MTIVGDATALGSTRPVTRKTHRLGGRSDDRPRAADELERLARWIDEAVPEGARLVLHGEVTTSAMPHLDVVLDQVVSLDPTALTVDLRQATAVSLDALATIARRARAVGRFDLWLPERPAAALRQLLEVA